VLGSAKDTQAFKEALARRIEKAKRKQDARREIEQAKEQARIDNALAWIVEQADLPARMRRAAAEGRSGALDEVADYLTQALGKEAQRLAREALPNWRPEWATYVDTYDFEVPERVPSDDAYAVRDALVEGQASMRAAALADDGGEIEVSECGRADIAPTGKSVWRGAVRVTVRHRQLGIDMRATVLTEPLAYGGESEDER